jgi:hypothetical protein
MNNGPFTSQPVRQRIVTCGGELKKKKEAIQKKVNSAQ